MSVDKLIDVAWEVGALLLKFSELVTQSHSQVEAVSVYCRMHKLVRVLEHAQDRGYHYEGASLASRSTLDDFFDDYSCQKTDRVDIDVQLTFDLFEALTIE